MSTTAQAASGPSEGDAGEAIKSMGLDAAITAAFDGATDPNGDTPKGTTPGEDIADELTNPEVAKLRDKSAKPTDNAGDDRAGEDAAAATESVDATKDKAVAPEGDKAKALEAPKHWPEADRAAFAKLPKDGQEISLKLARNLEAGFTRKSQELSDTVKYAHQVRGLLSDQERAQLRQQGVSEVGAFQHLMQLQRFSAQRPTEYVQWAMQTLGVKPEDVFPQMKATAPAQAPGKDAAPGQQAATPEASPTTGDAKLDELLADPAVKQLKSELAETKALLDQVAGKLTARERSELQSRQNAEQQERTRTYQQEQAIVGQIREFATTLDGDGRPAYPHFETLFRSMGALMDTDPDLRKLPDGPEKMKAAYDAALWARPDLRTGFIEAEANKRVAAEKASAAQAAAVAQKKAEADRARRVTGVRPASGAPTQKAKVGSLDDAINSAFSKSGF